VSGLQYQPTPSALEPRVPWYVYVSALLLLGWGSLVLIEWVSMEQGSGPWFWRVMGPVAVELAIGAGLLFRKRWAWVLGIATSVVFIAEGLRRLIFVRVEYEWLVVLVDYSIPAIVMLVCLLPARARRAFLSESRASLV
jgi:hypothetical protein